MAAPDGGSSPGPAIEIDGLRKFYGPIGALDGVSLEVRRSEIFGLVGPNGSGKSTLIKAICGLLKPTDGSVRVLGLNAGSQRSRVRRHLGYMPQTASLYDDLSPWENLVFFGSAYRTEGLKRRIREVLEFVELWDRRDGPLHTFSGGMRQRASLACALLRDPELLILDEPTAGVDPKLRQSFWDRFTGLKNAGRTIFVSTNQMDEALRCDRVAVILAGRLLIVETPQAIRARGRSRITISLPDGDRVLEAADYEQELPRLLEQFGLEPAVRRIRVERPSLEDVILALIGAEGAGD